RSPEGDERLKATGPSASTPVDRRRGLPLGQQCLRGLGTTVSTFSPRVASTLIVFSLVCGVNQKRDFRSWKHLFRLSRSESKTQRFTVKVSDQAGCPHEAQRCTTRSNSSNWLI